MTSEFKTKESTSSRKSDWSEALNRARATTLLAIVLFATAWQTVHYHARFLIHSSAVDSPVTSNAQTPEVSSVSESGNHEDCLICQLKRQFSSVRIFHAPSVVLSLEVRQVRAAGFFCVNTYRSAEDTSVGGRGPPASLLS